jgi:hypothetical protein
VGRGLILGAGVIGGFILRWRRKKKRKDNAETLRTLRTRREEVNYVLRAGDVVGNNCHGIVT